MIHIVLGTKAQLVKMAPIMAKLQERSITYNFIFTGQHRETISEMLHEFKLKGPDIKLYDGPDIVSVPQMVLWMLRILGTSLFSRDKIFHRDREGIVLVHGDTFSTLLGALMAKIAGLKVGHVESGLRSFRLLHPFPEELTRLATFRLSDLLFCPGAWAVKNMEKYAARKEVIDTEVNTMYDTVKLASGLQRDRRHVPDYHYGVASLHRYENIFNRKILSHLVDILERIAEKVPLLFILHPPTEKQLKRFRLYDRLSGNPAIELRPRYPYHAFLSLLEGTEFIVTDGGSIQEESSYIGIPCLLLRHATERQEGLGNNVVLSGLEVEKIDDFVHNYPTWRKKITTQDANPTAIILDRIHEYV